MALTTKPRQELPAAFREEALRALSAAQADPGWLAERRREALARALELPAPGREEESWRRTDPARFRLERLAPGAAGPAPGNDGLDRLLHEFGAAESRGALLATWDGATVRREADPAVEAAARFTDFGTAAREHGEVLRRQLHGGAPVAGLDHWTALGAAFATGGGYLRVARGRSVEAPLWLVHRLPSAGRAVFLHTVLHLEPGSSATVVEVLQGEDEAGGLAYQSLDVRVEAGAQLRYFRLQELGARTVHLARERLYLHRDASAEWGWGALGAAFAKSEMEADLLEEGARALLSGFYHGAGSRHLDHRTFQNHVQGHTTSDLLYKGSLEQRARSVYAGLIRVHRDAQRSDAYQANRNLVLSPEARADSIPSLEIEANDVRCTHGATVGQLEEEQLFYLRSRGLRPSEAARLIVEGFYEPVFDRLGAEPLRALARSRLQARLTL
ncbi:MAG TPA: Fe-S cluster assembly protein SufD [Candidatus Saccharimonadales bacterium]|nr:Fe-S cluster assembly protein SufD [Candidatus Saccharimonadales bacterium]